MRSQMMCIECLEVRACYGYLRNTHCANCKNDDMVFLNAKTCKCGVRASYGYTFKGEKICCSKCKTSVMVNLTFIPKKTCKNCPKSPSFGSKLTGKREYCKGCAPPDMINVAAKRCECGTTASFGFLSDKKRICCSKCKTDDMVNIKKLNNI